MSNDILAKVQETRQVAQRALAKVVEVERDLDELEDRIETLEDEVAHMRGDGD